MSTHDARLVPIADRVMHIAEDSAGADAERVAVACAAGEVVFRPGNRSDLTCPVDEGEVEVVRELADGGEEVLATVGPGRYVGELGPLGFPRSATIRAGTDLRLPAYRVRQFRRRLLDCSAPPLAASDEDVGCRPKRAVRRARGVPGG